MLTSCKSQRKSDILNLFVQVYCVLEVQKKSTRESFKSSAPMYQWAGDVDYLIASQPLSSAQETMDSVSEAREPNVIDD